MTLTVHFKSYAKDPKGVVLGTAFLLTDKKITMDDAAKAIVSYQDIVEPDTLEVVTPKDGERFMRALPHNFSGSYFRAELVES